MQMYPLTIILVLIFLSSTTAVLSRKEAKYYEILDSSPQDEYLTIKARYRTLALKYHPDRNQHDTTAQMLQINEAFDFVSKHLNKGEERTFSAQGTQIVELVQAVWEGIPADKKAEIAEKVKLYWESEHIGEDFVLMINSIFSPEDQGFWMCIVVWLFTSGALLMSIGMYTVVHYVFRILWFGTRLTWSLLFAVLRFVCSFCGASTTGKAKQH